LGGRQKEVAVPVSLSELRRLWDEREGLRREYKVAEGQDAKAELFEQHELATLRLGKALNPAFPSLLAIAEAARKMMRELRPFGEDENNCVFIAPLDDLRAALRGVEP
jgi:hypothetical protein